MYAPQPVSEHGGGGFHPAPHPLVLLRNAMAQHHAAPQMVSEHGDAALAGHPAMGGHSNFMPHQAPTPDAFAAQRLQQLQQMLGPQVYQALMQQQGQGGPDDRMGTAALWRQVSPVMGAMVQAQHGMTPQQNISGFSPQVQSLVQSVLARQQQANQGGGIRPGAQLTD